MAGREITVMSIPDGETATMECSECGPLGMIASEDIRIEQFKHRNYHREQWLAEQEA